MDKGHASLFQVYLRLRPAASQNATDRFLSVEEAEDASSPTHITLNPPNDKRRAVEKFGFTQVFEEGATQLDIFHFTGVAHLVEGVINPHGSEGTDALIATLGVTGSGKSHTILGSKSQCGMTQLALNLIFRSIKSNVVDCFSSPSVESSINASDASEANLIPAQSFCDNVYGDPSGPHSSSRAQTPMLGESFNGLSTSSRKQLLQRPTTFPNQPDISSINVPCDPGAEYAVLVSMYEVYNDRIFDLLSPPVKIHATKELRRRPLLFKSTEQSPDRKVVAGLRKVICANLKEALMVLEAALHERRVAGTGSNSASSRSHGFFCVEVKKRPKGRHDLPWSGNTLTIADLAGSERARDAKTAGVTLAEAGKINESLMYLGQCLQMQSDIGSSNKSNVVPFRQCKLTELLFSNSFPSSLTQSTSRRRNPQKGVMIVTADPFGDFNATSQILRYSALAREVTAPRIPSITQQILAAAGGPSPSAINYEQPSSPPPPLSSPVTFNVRPFYPAGISPLSHHQSPTAHSPRMFSPTSETMEFAALEISRLHEELEESRIMCMREREGREKAEAHLETFEASIEDKMLELEIAIRNQVAEEYEERFALEVSRLQNYFSLEQERGEEHMNRKLEALGRGLGAYEEDEEDKENMLVESLDEENRRLRYELEIMRRELGLRNPEKRRPLTEREASGVASTPSRVASTGHNPRKDRRGTDAAKVTASILERGIGEWDLSKKMAGLRMDDGYSIERSRNNSPASAVRTGSPTKKTRKGTAAATAVSQRRFDDEY